MAEPGYWLYKFDGKTLGTTLDLTGAEVRRLEKRLGVMHMQIVPIMSIDHRLAVLETFLARTMEADDARSKVEALSLRQLDEDCIEFVDGASDDLPEVWEDGLPKSGAGPTTT